MKKLEKRFEKIKQKSYDSESFIRNLSLEFQKKEINLLINKKVFLKYVIENIINSNTWNSKIEKLKKALLESLFEYKKISKNKIYLENIKGEIYFSYITKRYSEVENKNIKLKKVYDYLLCINFEFNKEEQKESVFSDHHCISINIIEAIEKLIEQIELNEEKRKRIRDF